MNRAKELLSYPSVKLGAIGSLTLTYEAGGRANDTYRQSSS